jgi:hypothetical protein
MSESFAPPPPGELDPHASKLSPDDPRLGLARPRARTLRTGPIALLMVCLLVAIVLALALAFQPPASKSKAAAEPSGAPAPPTIPDAIRNADASHPPPAASKDAARPAPNARAEAAVDDPALRAARELDQKARGASIFFESAGGVNDRDAPNLAPTAPRTDLGGSEAAALSAAATAPASDPNLQGRKNAFLDGKGAGKG